VAIADIIWWKRKNLDACVALRVTTNKKYAKAKTVILRIKEKRNIL